MDKKTNNERMNGRMKNRDWRGRMGVRAAVVLTVLVTSLAWFPVTQVNAEEFHWTQAADSAVMAASEGGTFRVGGEIELSPGEETDNLVAIGASVTVGGTVDGTVIAIDSPVEVTGEVTEDIVAIGHRVNLGPTAVVDGDVVTIGGRLTRDDGAQIHGEVIDMGWEDGFQFVGFPMMGFGMGFGVFRLATTLFGIVAVFALAIILLAVIPQPVRSIGEYVEGQFGRSLGIGILAAILMVPLSMLLLITLVGTPLLWLAFGAAALVGYASIAWLVGERIGQRFGLGWAEIWTLLLGVALLAVVRAIPLIGGIVTFLVVMTGVGAVLGSRFGTNKPWFQPRPE